MDISSLEYKRAFDRYLRTGIPIRLSQKQARPTTRYIWRTRKDNKVRPSHAANDGKIFAWNNPPSTGHPGEDYGCRCVAEPFVPSVTEFMDISLSNVNDHSYEWTDRDFVNHYLNGNGRAILLRDTGHLIKIVEAYKQRAHGRLKEQIAQKARKGGPGSIFYDFRRFYPVKDVVFSLGKTEIGGEFTGTVTRIHQSLQIFGNFDFYLEDDFTDPGDIAHIIGGTGWNPPGTAPYDISDRWNGSLRALVLVNAAASAY